ncbi:MAG TPA: hypothetical protein VGF61_15540 [Candidatus Acidoferrum sp.]|jgi:hypothetical protein
MSKKFAETIAVSMSQLEQLKKDPLSLILNFTRKWNKWYSVLRYGKGFGLFDSLRYGLWLARSCA